MANLKDFQDFPGVREIDSSVARFLAEIESPENIRAFFRFAYCRAGNCPYI